MNFSSLGVEAIPNQAVSMLLVWSGLTLKHLLLTPRSHPPQNPLPLRPMDRKGICQAGRGEVCNGKHSFGKPPKPMG